MKRNLLTLFFVLLIPCAVLAQEAYAIYENHTLTFYYDDMKDLRNGTVYALNSGKSEPGWRTNIDVITKVVFAPYFSNARPTSTYDWFGGATGLAEIEGIQYLNTESVTTMENMFYNCSKLQTIDLGGFNTAKVTSMSSMFRGCNGLTSLDLSSFDTSIVTSMHHMFQGCSGLTSLDLSSFDTSSVTSMRYMFYDCSSLTSLDLSSFDTSSVTNMDYMFSGCSGLTTIYCGNDWNTDKVTYSFRMFYNCINLVGGAGTVYNSNYIDKTYAHVDGGPDNPGYLTFKNSSQGGETPVDAEAYVVYNDGTLTFYYDGMKSSRSGTKYELNNSYNDPGWYTDHRTDITTVVFDATFAEARPTSTYRWFAVSYNETSVLTSIEGIEYLNTSEVTTMLCMFEDCSGLTSLDLSNFNTGSVTDMRYMFSGCSGLTSLDLSSFDTSNVTDMSGMFYNCSGLTSLDLSSFDTSNVTDMSGMFYNCSCLTSLDLSSFDTSSVRDMKWMFSGCRGLTSLDLSKFNTSSVMSMQLMFAGCSGLTSLDLSSFNTSSVLYMISMFRDCSGLTSLDLSSFNTSSVLYMISMFRDCSGLTSLDLSNFDTSSVTDMDYMFSGCSGLTSLDLSSFDTSSVTDMQGIFRGCSGLTTIYCGNDWNTDKVTSSSDMFYNCINLVGGAGTVYNSNYIDKTYAHVDGGPDNPGYLTFKNSSQGGETPGEPEVYVVYNGGTLTFYYDGMKSSRSGTKYELNNSYNNPGWYTDHRTDITTVVFDATFAEARPTSTYRWFAVGDNETSVLTSIEGIEYLNTSNVKTMGNMFYGCSGLTSLDLRSFDTGSVTYMSFMFSGCSGLTSLDLSSFNTSSVEHMYEMFKGCSGLTSLDLSSFDTSSVTYMSFMFAGCSGLTSLDLRSFDTSSVTHMPKMFYSCSGLTSLDLSSFDTGNVTYMGGMFEGCSKLTSLDLSSFDTSSVTEIYSMFEGCSSLTTIYCGDYWNTDKVTSSSDMFSYCTNLVGGAGTVYNSNYIDKTYAHVDGGPNNPGYLTLKGSSQGGETPVDAEAYVVYNDGTLTFYYDGMKSSRSGTKYELNTGYNDPGWYTDHRTDITTVVFDATFAEARPTSTYRWFAVEDNETSVLTSIEGIEYLNTSSVTTMYYMFKGRSGLTSLDLRSFDTSSVTNMGDMFYGCSGLTSLDLSSFNTSSVTYISYMFYGCSGLTSLDLSSFDTSSVMIMFKMFQGCSGLTSLDLSNFNTSSVRDMGDMFSGCSGLTSLDLSNFDTSSVEDMTLMFWSCRSLTSLDLSSFDTSSVTDMYAMFYGCSGLTSLDLSNFNTSSVTDMQDMFRGCSGLTTIYCGNDWNTDKVTSSSGMFYNCINLVGGAGTVYNSNYIDKTYAHVDGSPDNPGYLTLKDSGAPVYALGDVNRDGSVDIGDIVMTINVMTGSETDADIMAAADVNSDDCVDIGDIVAIIDIMTSSPAAARAQRAPAATDADDYIETAATGNDIVVGLNNQHAFTAFQMVLTLPTGCTLNEVLIDSKRGSRHIADVKTLANGSYLVMGYSLNNKLLKGNEGLLFTITTAGVQPTGAVISDVLFATAEGGTYRLAGIEVGTAGTTGVSTVNGRTETADPVYDLNGRRRVTTAKDALLPGLYIINGKKTVIK